MARKKSKSPQGSRRVFTREFKEEAVQMILDGHKPSAIAERLGISRNLLYRWKRDLVEEAGPAATALEAAAEASS